MSRLPFFARDSVNLLGFFSFDAVRDLVVLPAEAEAAAVFDCISSGLRVVYGISPEIVGNFFHAGGCYVNFYFV